MLVTSQEFQSDSFTRIVGVVIKQWLKEKLLRA